MSEPDGLPAPQRYLAAAAVMLGILMASLDSAIVNLALPRIGEGLAVTPASVVWVANGYQVASAACMLTCAAMGTRFGQRRVFSAGLVAFTLASLGCALSTSFEWLVALRIVQGAAYAALVSIGLGLYRTIFPSGSMGTVLGLNALIVSFGTAAGPALGGLIITWLPWQWLFLVNVPLGVLAVLLAWRAIPGDRPGTGGFDMPGALLSAAGMCILVLGVDRLASLDAPQRWAVFGTSTLCLVLFIVRQKYAAHPLLPLDIFSARRFNLAVSASVCVFVAQGLALVALPFLLQGNLGYDILQSALLFTAWPLAVVVCAPLSGRLSGWIQPAWIATAGLLVLAIGLSSLAMLPVTAGSWDIIWRIGLCGAGYGVFLPPNNQELLGNVARDRTSTASGILSTARTLGQSLGAALVALALLMHSSDSQLQQVEGFILWVFGGACLFTLLAGVASIARLPRQPVR